MTDDSSETRDPAIPSWRGVVMDIHVAERAGAPMQSLDEAELVAGHGIRGDRYAEGLGFYSDKPAADRQVTLFEIETIEALARDHGITVSTREHRRNVTVRDVPLNHLVGRTFRVGSVLLYGGRLNKPCRYLDKLVGQRLFEKLLHRSGLNCEIREGGVVRPGDTVEPV
ncbi:MAG: MOSC domain-containing protein [Methyloligellaceae bacterium]